MNKNDGHNLAFLIQTYEQGEEALDEWLNSLEEDEVQYALELLSNYHLNKIHFQNIINKLFD